MAITDINSDGRLIQQIFAERLEKEFGWESVYAYSNETFGPESMQGLATEREVVQARNLLSLRLKSMGVAV